MNEQVKRTPMGFLVSSVIAEEVLLKLKKRARRTSTPKFRARYFDGTLTIVRRDHVGALKEHLKSIFLGVQFTMILEKDSQLPFLSVMVKSITDGDLTVTVHRIATTTIGMLHFSSNQLVGCKVSFLRALVNRINGDKCRPKNRNCRRQPDA